MDTNFIEKNTINLGDKRLNRRFVKIIERCSKNPSSSIPGTFENWGQIKAAYRLFDSDKVSKEKILENHYKATIKRIQLNDNQEPILLIQDTSELNYSTHSSKKELGKTQSRIKHGLVIHPTIAITSARILLGIVAAKMWTRNTKEQAAVPHRRTRPIEEKESYRWLESFQLSEEIAKACPEKKIINIADKEGDIHELLLKASQTTVKNVFFLVRSSHNRITTNQNKKISAEFKACKTKGHVSYLLKRRGHAARNIKQEVRFTSLTLKTSEKSKAKPLVPVWALSAQELVPKKGQTPIKWILLTTMPIHNLTDAIEAIRYYLARWEIEVFFKVLKSGCNIEQLQLKKLQGLLNCIATYMIVAWRVMFLTKLGREYPELSADIIFSDIEWKAAYAAVYNKKPPLKPPPIREIMLCVAKLGGYLSRSNDSAPGYKTIWAGIQKLDGIVRGYMISKLLD